ncbi:hypothetical protein [Pandoraea sp. XY-2]|uniref:hypothetical protein n=1 Tax=Pandoraea sp. XY-2 TaxID=2518599 RepID=UPI001F0F426D|nr:hypothetical protein [Pandoraea sp. XY-2]
MILIAVGRMLIDDLAAEVDAGGGAHAAEDAERGVRVHGDDHHSTGTANIGIAREGRGRGPAPHGVRQDQS